MYVIPQMFSDVAGEITTMTYLKFMEKTNSYHLVPDATKAKNVRKG